MVKVGEQASQCANELGISIEEKTFCGASGHQSRMMYFMKK